MTNLLFHRNWLLALVVWLGLVAATSGLAFSALSGEVALIEFATSHTDNLHFQELMILSPPVIAFILIGFAIIRKAAHSQN